MGWMRRGRKLEDNVVKATYAFYANGSNGSFTYYTEEECKGNVGFAAIKLELARCGRWNHVVKTNNNSNFFSSFCCT